MTNDLKGLDNIYPVGNLHPVSNLAAKSKFKPIIQILSI